MTMLAFAAIGFIASGAAMPVRTGYAPVNGLHLYYEINPDRKHLEALFLQDSRRMNAFQDWPATDLESIAAPVLVIVGDQDVVTPEHALKMSRLLQHGRLAILPGNHGSYLGEAASSDPSSRAPEATVILIEEFLSSPPK